MIQKKWNVRDNIFSFKVSFNFLPGFRMALQLKLKPTIKARSAKHVVSVWMAIGVGKKVSSAMNNNVKTNRPVLNTWSPIAGANEMNGEGSVMKMPAVVTLCNMSVEELFDGNIVLFTVFITMSNDSPLKCCLSKPSKLSW